MTLLRGRVTPAWPLPLKGCAIGWEGPARCLGRCEKRLINRPPLEEGMTSKPPDKSIGTSYREYGYKLREIGDYLDVHDSTVSRRLRQLEGSESADG